MFLVASTRFLLYFLRYWTSVLRVCRCLSGLTVLQFGCNFDVTGGRVHSTYSATLTGTSRRLSTGLEGRGENCHWRLEERRPVYSVGKFDVNDTLYTVNKLKLPVDIFSKKIESADRFLSVVYTKYKYREMSWKERITHFSSRT